MLNRLLLAATVVSGSFAQGCFLPVGTAQPQGGRTLGKGGAGITLVSEVPTVDLLGTLEETDGYARSPFPQLSVQGAYGLTQRLDVEVAVEGVQYYFVAPILLGGSIGGRFQFLDREDIAAAAYARVGYVGLGAEDSDADTAASATYVQAGVGISAWPSKVFRPTASISLMPAFGEVQEAGATDSFTAFAANATLGLMFGFGPVEVGPFFNAVFFASSDLAGSDFFPTAASCSVSGHRQNEIVNSAENKNCLAAENATRQMVCEPA